MTKTTKQKIKADISGRNWEWQDRWVEPPIPVRGGANQRTHGVTVLRDGRILIFHQAIPAVLIYSPDGKLLKKWGDYPGAHGLTHIFRGNQELLWLTDEILGLAELTDLSGRVLARLEKPNLPIYQEKPFVPTWVAEDSVKGKPVRLWLADGYGSHFVHAYDCDGRYEFSLTGEEGAGRFSCPHGIAIDPRPGHQGALLVADRGNRRVQEFDRNGKYLGTWGADFLHSPDGFNFRGEHCVMAELYGRITIVDGKNQLVDFLGEQKNARHLAQWPLVDRSLLFPGLFNSPHHAAWGPQGEIYVVEWIRYGRITKLVPLD